MFESKANTTLLGVIVYLVLVLAAPLGKLLGLGHLASLPWRNVTVLVWGPWLLSGAFWLLLGLVALGENLLKKKTHPGLPGPRS